MIISANVPSVVCNWALCQRNLAELNTSLDRVERDLPLNFAEAQRFHFQHRRRSAEEKQAVLKQIRRKIFLYTRLKERIEQIFPIAPASFLMPESEIHRLPGKVFHISDNKRKNKIYTTCTHLSSDGKRACFDGKETEWDSLALLCRGIGKGTAAR